MKPNILQITASIALLSSLAFSVPDVWAGHKRGNFCSKTTHAAFRACRIDAQDNFWTSTGICLNVSDDQERRECHTNTKQEKHESLALCQEQKEAREDVCEILGEGRYDPEINPSDFVNPLDIGNTVAPNTYMPLVPGFTRIYEAGDETITVTITEETIEIQGVTCIVVHDVVEEDGVPIEDTVDWFAQDIYGNVWYFGEIAKNYENGQLKDLDGSWMAGEDGAKAGIAMKAVPQVGDVYRQEWTLTEAEDMGEVLSTAGSESVPAASCNSDCLITHDFTPIEPDVNENKFYAPGIGVIVSYHVDEPDDREELVEYHY